MNKIYTTEELIQILAQERRACLQGQRLNMTSIDSGNPLIDKFIKAEGLQKFTAYQDFKATIHQYQRDYNISGIEWRSLSIKNQNLVYPVIHEDLISLENDIHILQQSKQDILSFWYELTTEMDLYLTLNNGQDYCQITTEDVQRIAQRTEWAILTKIESKNYLELMLQLGWGKPEDASYKRGLPQSGSEFIYAVYQGDQVKSIMFKNTLSLP
jgi:hypothetical protein